MSGAWLLGICLGCFSGTSLGSATYDNFGFSWSCIVAACVIFTSVRMSNLYIIQAMMSGAWLLFSCLGCFLGSSLGGMTYDYFGFSWSCMFAVVIMLVSVCMHNVQCTLHIAQCTLHIAKCTLHIPQCTLQIPQCTLHIAQCT